MSSADTAAAKKAAGQLQQDLGSGESSKATYQEGVGMEKADKGTGASGLETTGSAKDVVKEQTQGKSD